eukprot:gnl/MRDRNA2_/MRDRNA2_64770_c0_seq1.p1 gnl/MRDRNA2_/MRDRNA2_64770_c0~~gnl/MRDRNA2_/MRDRNA2_64770_c0_seq1.p1  ORF type:complete len:173 (+),score=14.45 gnl/MRDRNA2_/MRDRNA2_64770_c0_seq1:302-820(+)
MSAETFQERQKLRLADPFFYHWPGGESLADLELRARDFCRDLLHTGALDIRNAETVILVTHAVTSLVIIKVLLGGSCDDVVSSKSLSNCEFAVLDWIGPGSRDIGCAPLSYRLSSRINPNVDGQPILRHCQHQEESSASSPWRMFKDQIPASFKQRRMLKPLVRSEASQATM